MRNISTTLIHCLLYNRKHALKYAITSLIALACYTSANAQMNVPWFGNITWTNGYAREIQGQNLSYTSAYADYATVSLLTRCTDGKKDIEWETAPIPEAKKNDKYIYYGWVASHSTGTSKGERHFDLWINGEKVLVFTTYPANAHPDWTFGASDSTRVVFKRLKTDAVDDAHGLMFLRLPAHKYPVGKPLDIKIVGENQNSNDWYMTFEFSFEEKIDVSALPFLLNTPGTTQIPLAITILHFGKDESATILLNGKDKHTFKVVTGVNNYQIPLAIKSTSDTVQVKAIVGENILVDKKIVFTKPVQRTLYLIHHSHTDIGYSYLQPEVARIQIKNINDALRQIERTKKFPIEARFKWNVESLWAVENYMKQATPEQKQKLIQAVKNGDICLSGLYANMLTGISEPEEMFHYCDYAAKLTKEYGIVFKNAMITDIPGYSWNTVRALAYSGIRYLSSGPNSGDRTGSFTDAWGDKPVWWVSPSGDEKILFWTAAKGYSSWHGMPIGGIWDKGPKKIAQYVSELEAENYPYDMVQWRYNVVSDNAPIDSTISDFIVDWNKKYTSPKLILSTTDDMFERMEDKYGKQLPVVQGDITPYWEDGAASTAEETGDYRINSLKAQQLAALYSIISPAAYNPASFYEAWKGMILYCEHTWGAWNSISDPDQPFVTEQWRIKKQYLTDGIDTINKIQQKLLQSLSDMSSETIAVVNTASWTRSGLVYIDASIAKKGNAVRDSKDNIMPIQKLSDGSGVFMAKDVAALGTSYYILIDKKDIHYDNALITSDTSIANNDISIRFNKEYGSIKSLYWKNRQIELADTFKKQGLNSYWYMPGSNPALIQTNKQAKITVKEHGSVLTRVEVTSSAPGSNGLKTDITLVNGTDEVAITNTVDKTKVREKESVHFAYPFNVPQSITRGDDGYGVIKYPCDQLPGSNKDYYCARQWVDVSNQDYGVTWLIQEAPMFEMDSIVDERMPTGLRTWKLSARPSARLFSYAMNNYWGTNYKADQEGLATFHYAIKPHDMFRADEMAKNAYEFNNPLIAIPVKQASTASSLFTLSNTKVIVTSIEPLSSNTYKVRLYNPEAVAAETAILGTATKNNTLKMGACEMKEIIVSK